MKPDFFFQHKNLELNNLIFYIENTLFDPESYSNARLKKLWTTIKNAGGLGLHEGTKAQINSILYFRINSSLGERES